MSGALCAILEVIARARLKNICANKLVANAIVVLLKLGVDACVDVLRGVNEDRVHKLYLVAGPQIRHNKHALHLHEALGRLEVVRAQVVVVQHRDSDCLFGDQLTTLVAHNRNCLELSVRAVETVGGLGDAGHHLEEETRFALIFGDRAEVLLAEEGKNLGVYVIQLERRHCGCVESTIPSGSGNYFNFFICLYNRDVKER